MTSPEHTYAGAGVSLATADAIVDRLRAAVASTATAAVAGAFGAFAGLFAIDERRLLAASTDSVGSKLVLGRRGDRLRWCGADLAAHCINDVLTTGAEPLFFLDYVAANTIDVEQVAELIEGAADVCRVAGCAILGGETAELPGHLPRGRDRLLRHRRRRRRSRPASWTGRASRKVTSSSAIASAGIHANGFSLVRKIVGDGAFDADLLLPPTRLYLDDVRALRARADVRALAHVTGGGIAGNLGARPARTVSARSSIRRPGSARRSSRGLPTTASPRTSCGASSTSGSATAQSSRPADVHPADNVIGHDRRRGRGLLGMTREPGVGVLVSGSRLEPPGSDRRGDPHRGRRLERRGSAALERAAAAGHPHRGLRSDRVRRQG